MPKNIDIILYTQEGMSAQHTVVSKSGKPFIIKAHNGVTYALKDSAAQVSPDQIVTKRVGKNLHINLSAEQTGLDDIIIEDYYSVKETDLVGVADNGQTYSYLSSTQDGLSSVSSLTEGISSFSLLGTVPTLVPPVVLSTTPVWMYVAGGVLAAGGVALVAGGGGGGSTPAPVIPTPLPDTTPDTTSPTATITMSDTALIKGDTSTVTVKFSEAVAGFSNADVTAPNGTLSTFTTSDNITWTATFTPTQNITDTTNVITLANTYTDTAGNTGTTASSVNYTVDISVASTGPTLVSAFPSDDMTKVLANENILLTFNENVYKGTGNIKIVNAGTGATKTISITDATQVHISGKYVTINPSSDLSANANYYVQIDATAIKNGTDLTYSGISNATTLNFSTVPIVSTFVDPDDSSALIGSEDADSDRKWGGALGDGVTLSYSFATSTTTNSYESGYTTKISSVLNDTHKNSFRTALQRWSEVANLNFVEVPDTGAGTGGIVRVAFYDDSADTAHGKSYYPTSHYTGADVWLGQSYRSTYFTLGPTEPLGGMQTMIHEMGHALALAHPNDWAEDPDFTKLETIMSYNEQDHSYIYLNDGTNYRIYDRSPMVLDIAAMQTLYGVNMVYNSTDTVYTFDHNVPFFMSIWDAGGNDTINLSNMTKGSTIDLRDGHYSSVRMDIDNLDMSQASEIDFYDGTNNLGIAYNAIIENAIGGNGNDILIGNDAANILNGGVGIDMVGFSGATAGVNVTLHGDGAYGSDTWISIEGLLGSDHDDTLTGDSSNNIIEGGLGSDVLNGAGGIDTVSYQLASVAVTVNLSLATAQNTGGAGSDTLSNFENIIGSIYNDTLTGNSGDNTLNGGIGDDTLIGGNGNDILEGGWGDDILSGGAGSDTFALHNPDSSSKGGLGKDTIMDFVSDFDAVFDVNEDRIDLSHYFSALGITVTTSNIEDFLWMDGSTMRIDRNGGGDSYTSLLIIGGTSNVFDDNHLSNLLTAGQIIA